MRLNRRKARSPLLVIGFYAAVFWAAWMLLKH